MCGISGIISRKKLTSRAIVDSLRSIRHRGPDNCLYTDGRHFYSSDFSNQKTKQSYPRNSEASPIVSESNLWLGFNRLSIVDMSDNGMQPFFDKESGSYFMLNGEVYNYEQLKREHLSEESFFSDSDSEVAYKLYLKFGDDFVQHLEGMFAICIYHTESDTLKIWRDRFGIKPMYYYQDDDVFVFSSEVKGILDTGLVEKNKNYSGIAYSMYLGACPSPLTIYDEIYSVRPAHKFEYSFREKKSKSAAYWKLDYDPSAKNISAAEFQKDVEEICLLYSSRSHAKALMLSGGLDSGQLAYSFSKVDKSMKGLTIFQPDSKYNELEYTKINAANANLQLEAIEVAYGFTTDEIRDYQSSEEEPNVVPEPTLIVSKVAKQQNIKVLYNGLGPDEIFGGYAYYQQIRKLSKFLMPLKLLPAGLLPSSKKNKLTEINKFGIATFPLISRQVFSWGEVQEYLNDKAAPIPDHPIDFLLEQVKKSYPNYDRLPILKQASYLDLFYYIPSYHALRSDRPSMLSSVELRFPFLNYKFVQKYFNQTDTFDNIANTLKPKMRMYVKDVLPETILQQPKKGFGISTSNQDESSTQKEWYFKSLELLFADVS